MIESLLHLIGICPDHIAHFDLIDFTTYNWINVVDMINLYYKKIKKLI